MFLEWLNLGPTFDLAYGRSYVPGPVGLMYFNCSGNLPFNLNPPELSKKLPLFEIWGQYSPGPSGNVFFIAFLWALPKVLNVEEWFNFKLFYFSASKYAPGPGTVSIVLYIAFL